MTSELNIIIALQQAFNSPLGHAYTVFTARWLIIVATIIVSAVALFSKSHRYKHAARESLWASFLAFGIAAFSSLLIDRIRPFVFSNLIHILIPPPATRYAFPSGHSSFAFALAFGFLFSSKSKWSWLLMTVAVLVAFGRVLAGVHYPTDVFAGLCVGLFSAGVVRYFHYKIRRPL